MEIASVLCLEASLSEQSKQNKCNRTPGLWGGAKPRTTCGGTGCLGQYVVCQVALIGMPSSEPEDPPPCSHLLRQEGMVVGITSRLEVA